MLFEVDLVYRARVRKKGSSATYIHRFKEPLAVEIEALSGPEAPVAVRLPENKVLRAHSGELLSVPESYHDHGKDAPALVVDGWEGGPFAARRFSEFEHPKSAAASRDALIDRADPSIAKVLEDDRDDMLALLLRRASMVKLVDGVPHVPAEEPVYTLENGSLGIYKFQGASAMVPSWPLVQRDEAVAAARESGAFGIETADVLMPEALKVSRLDLVLKTARRCEIIARGPVRAGTEGAEAVHHALLDALRSEAPRELATAIELYTTSFLRNGRFATENLRDHARSNAELYLAHVRQWADAIDDENALSAIAP